MRNISLPVLQSLLFGTPAYVDLLEIFALRTDTPDIRLCMSDQSVVWSGHEYKAASIRTPSISQSLTDQIGQLELVIPNVNNELALMLETLDVGDVRVLVRRLVRDRMGDDDSFTIYDGRIRSVGLDLGVVSIVVEPLTTQARDLASVPRRIYSSKCSRTFGDAWCTKDLSTVTQEVVCGSSSSEIFIECTPAPADASWMPAVLICRTGLNINQSRPIREIQAGAGVLLRKPFWVRPLEGDVFWIRRLCKKTLDACDGFDNLPHFDGFPYIPNKPLDLRRELL